MSLIDHILNWAALLLWLGWRSISLAQPPRSSGTSLLSTLKRAEPRTSTRWFSLAGLFGLLGVRSFFYWHIGSRVNWLPTLDLCAITLPFRSDRPNLMVVFSVLSFALLLGAFYSWLLLISAANRAVPATEPLQRLVRLHLGWIERCPAALKFFLPMLLSALLWGLFSPYLVRIGITPGPVSRSHLWEQALVLGLTSFLAWKFLLVGVFLLHLLNSYIYLGRIPSFNFVSLTARNLLRPLDWLPLRLGRMDFSPVLGILLVWFAAESGRRWFPELYERLPF